MVDDQRSESEPSAAERASVELPIVRITVLEDRAHVRREGRPALGAGLVRVRVDGVSPVLADKTLDVGAKGARVVAARVVRREIHERTDRPEVLREIEARVEEVSQKRAAVEERLNRGGTETRGLDRLLGLALSEIAQDVAWARVEADAWDARLDQIAERSRTLREGRLDAEQELRDLDATLERLRAQWLSEQRPTALVVAHVEIDLEVQTEGVVDLTLEYVVACAAWRPYHTAELVEGATTRVRLRTDGCVWQRSGEDWSDVEVLFSTERPSLGTEPPRLGSDVLRATRKSPVVVVETREQEITQAGLGAGESAGPRALPGIDDGGDVVLLKGRSRTSIPSDGRPYRVPLAETTGEAEAELLCVPDLVPAVLLKTVQTHQGSTPLLAGPVDLVRHAGQVGRTSVPFVAPGERFPLGWGPDGELRVQRDTERHEEEPGVLGSWITTHHAVRVHLSNLGPNAKTVHVVERVPVSEIEAVKVAFEPKKTTDAKDPDKDGFVRWTVRLAPYGRERVRLGYALRRQRDVVTT